MTLVTGDPASGCCLSLETDGFVAVNSFQQCFNHTDIFAAGDVASRVETPHARSGMYAARAGPSLLVNLRAAIKGQALTPYQAQKLNLLSCGGRHAIAIWGGISFEGA